MESPENNNTVSSGSTDGPYSATSTGSGQKPNRSIVRRVVILLPILVVLTFIWQPWKKRLAIPDPPEVHFDDSHSLVADTVGRARAIVVEQPQSATAWGRYGMCLYAHEYSAAAMNCFEQAANLDPKDYRWPYFKGICITFTDPEQGLKFFERSVDLRPDAVFIRMRAAELSLDLGQNDRAAIHIDAALAYEPRNARATLAAARLAMVRGHLDRAWECATQSNLANPNMRGSYEILSRICFQKNDLAASQKYLSLMNQATRTDDWPDPMLAEVMEMRRDMNWCIFQVQNQIDEGQTRQAMEKLDQLTTEFSNSVELRMESVRMLLSVEQFDEADRVLEEGLAVHPMSARLHRMRGLLHYQQGNKEQALEGFRQAVHLKPDYYLGHYSLGRCLLDLGDTAGAREAFQDAYALKPDLPGLQSDLDRLENQ